VDERVRGAAPGGAQPVLRSFLEAVDDRVLPTTVSKSTLTELCHALEDLVVADDLAGTVIAGFQRSRFWAVERERYAVLVADPRRSAVVFTADEGEEAPGVQRLVVGPDHPVAREWFVITLTSAFSAVLFGRELARSNDSAPAEREFVTVWSCDASVVEDLLTVLSDALADSVPGATAALATARAAHPPRASATGMTERFAAAFFERLELVTQRKRSLEAEVIDARRLLAELEIDRRRYGHGRPEPAATTTTGPPVADAGVTQAHHPEAPDGEDALVASRHALVLHGDAAQRGLIEALLRRSGWEVTAASSFDQGLDAATTTTFDAVLVDARLVDGDGSTLLAELDRFQPGAEARTALVSDVAGNAPGQHGRPIVSTPLVWSELEAVLEALTTTL
jgi:DICT domain-containing protein/CheY-like chemotaxis protein